tara:strand:+ start:4386 stop:4802 length:417 start_codon:yes stop_codon:yes gene_type:complete
MKSVKNIKLKKQYLENIEDLEETKKLTRLVIDNTFKDFLNEYNQNFYDYALNALTENYRYVPPKKCISAGSYIRYIDVKDTKKIRLHKGGFVIEDNGYSIKFISDEGFYYTLRRNHVILFVYIKEKEIFRIEINKMAN